MLDIEIVRYSTPTYRFVSNIDLGVECDKFRVVFTQFNREVFTKTENDIAFDGHYVLLHLNQEETALFYPEQNVLMTVRYKLKNGEVPPAKEFLLYCKGCKNEEVL